MRSLLVALALIVLPFGLLRAVGSAPFDLTTASGQLSVVALGLLACAPLVGAFLLLRSYVRWHLRFHRRMREEGLW